MDKICTIDDVKEFVEMQIADGLTFHPDDDFNDYININTGKPTYSRVEADLRNRLVNECFEVCEESGIDFYAMGMEIYIEKTGLSELYKD